MSAGRNGSSGAATSGSTDAAGRATGDSERPTVKDRAGGGGQAPAREKEPGQAAAAGRPGKQAGAARKARKDAGSSGAARTAGGGRSRDSARARITVPASGGSLPGGSQPSDPQPGTSAAPAPKPSSAPVPAAAARYLGTAFTGAGTDQTGPMAKALDAAALEAVLREATARDSAGPAASRSGRSDQPAAAALPRDRFLDREESWLRFSERVLELAEDEQVPLLERVRFASIFASGMDEFFMVRVGGRIRRMAAGLPVENAAGRPPGEILDRTLRMASGLSARHARCFAESLVPELNRAGIEILRWKELTEDERAELQTLFRERIYPVLTPLAVDPAHPFPFISNLSLSLAVTVADPRTGTTIFARVKVPPLLPRFLTVAPTRFVPLEDVIAAHLNELFIGLDVIEHHAFRVTRARDLEIDEDVTEDLLKSLERELMRRRFEPAVRLEVEESISADVLDKLVSELALDARAVWRVPGPLDLSGLQVIADLDMRDLKYPPFVPSETALPQDASVFATLAARDVLVHHPYDSFTASVQRLVVSAAADPRVLAIKHTLYRTSGDSEIVDALIDAAEAGKQVVVVVEIKARGDERANIAWARKLEEAGCHVTYGFLGLKTHCKMLLVVREEADGTLRRFVHIGTGNYHPKTARMYEDYGLLTADRTVGEDVTDLFNQLTGYSRRRDYGRLLVAPGRVRTGLIRQIEEQAARQREGLPARIQMKCNAIIDEATIDALYRASRDGVPIDLWIRGICALRPGVPGLSEMIRVRSIVGRFLEHSRIYAFGTGDEDDGDVWIGSPDLMHRNLDRRVEVLVRVTDRDHRAELRSLLNLAMDDGTASWWLGPVGTWTRHHLDASGQPLLDLHDPRLHQRHAPRDGNGESGPALAAVAGRSGHALRP